MKKFYSLVLMAAALLIGTNAWAENEEAQIGSTKYATIEEAWAAVQDGQTIELLKTADIESTLWLGTETMEDLSPKSITLDLKGFNLTATNNLEKMFFLSHGELNIVSNPAGGQIIHNPNGFSSQSNVQEVFRLVGTTYKTVNPKSAASGYYTHLNIGAGVSVTTNYNGIVIDNIASDAWPAVGHQSWKGLKATNVIATNGVNAANAVFKNNKIFGGKGSAYGVRIDVWGSVHGDKYAIKANGDMGSPYSPYTGTDATIIANIKNHKSSPSDTEGHYEVFESDKDYTPYIYLHNGSFLESNNAKKQVAVYAAGYCRWLVEGRCQGNVGLYIKSGEVVVNNAHVNSTGNTYYPPKGTTSGIEAGGSAIVVESGSSYSGDIDVTISGNSEITATNGYALEEKVTNAPSTEVESISIIGGTFDGGVVPVDPANPGAGTKEATIIISETTAEDQETKIEINGGTMTGSVNGVQIGDQNIEEFIEAQTGANIEIVGGNVVVNQGEAPTGEANIEGHATTAEIRWTGGATAYTLANDLTLKTLTINEAYAQTLIVPAGKKLTVDRAVLGANAQIIVEAGATMIVNGAQGIYAQKVDNLVLKTQEGNPAYLLFGPNVAADSHPKATVEFISKSFRKSSTNYFYQRFGIPTIGALTSITAKNPTTQAPVETGFIAWINKYWTTIGYIHSSKTALDYSKMANPFEYYQMLHNTTDMGTIVTMQGSLVGNENPNLNILGNGNWSMFANSYTGQIDAEALIDIIPTTAQQAFYLYDINAEQATWEAKTLDFLDNISPMQPFLIYNDQEGAVGTINYNDAVYQPAMSGASSAPARRNAASNITKAQIIVKGEDCIDRVGVVEGEQFSAAFDNGHEAVKYMNEGINMYISADKKMGVIATDNLNNTYVGLQTVNGGNYTIEFAKVQGEELTLVDHETGAQVAMVEGNTYEFTANGTNDYRFEIVEPAKLPTAIENAEAVKSAKGIYTITGQYVGEMSVWNTLPAGVYVVNGEKRVK